MMIRRAIQTVVDQCRHAHVGALDVAIADNDATLCLLTKSTISWREAVVLQLDDEEPSAMERGG